MTFVGGLAHAYADELLAGKWRISGASITGTPNGPFYAQMHSGDPGPNGTANVINANRRVLVSLVSTGQFVSSGAGTGQVESANDTKWINAADGRTTAAVTIWGGTGAATGPSGGTLVHTGPLIGSYSIGDDPFIPAGSLTDSVVLS